MRKSLVALDTDHIKGYVFGTDKLKEIRGASSILDYLNREEMSRIAHEEDPDSVEVYVNGGSGLFLVDSNITDSFGKRIQQAYREQTAGGATVTYAVQEIPENIKDPWSDNISNTLELLRYRLREKKDWRFGDHIALPSHVFMRPCDSCGMHYAEVKDEGEGQDPANQDKRYCRVCFTKRIEDGDVKDSIDNLIKDHSPRKASPLWASLITRLGRINYSLTPSTDRPADFNVFRNFGETKDYIGLIYADANGMGKKLEQIGKLKDLKVFAKEVDTAIYESVCDAIGTYLPVRQLSSQEASERSGLPKWLFPFDILLLGGDDLVIVTPASVAMDVALTIAKRFHERTNQKHTLSVGVILAPIKYPFGLLQDLAESTLKAAKKEGAKNQHTSAYEDTILNFLVVAGGTSGDFKDAYKSLHNKKVRVRGYKNDQKFYATLRPYTVEELEYLLDAIREGKKKSLGRTKLHEVREAVLKMNLTTSVGDALAVLRNWRSKQREFVVQRVYTVGGRYQAQHSDSEKPGSMFPRVTFPWFADGVDTYRTPLLDFVELYDFVTQEGGDSDDEN